jgi:chitinase
VASPAPPSGGGKKILGLKPRTALIAGGGILAAALAYFWWKGKQAAKTTSTSASASASASAYANQAQLDALQNELDELLTSSASTSAGSGGGSGSTGTTTAPGPPGAQPGGPISTGTGTTTAPAKTTAKTPAPAMPTGVHATKVTATSVTIAWAKDPNATFYPIRVTYQGKLVHTSGTAATSATVFGLTPAHTYTFHVKAQGPGGTSAETNGPAVKTSL